MSASRTSLNITQVCSCKLACDKPLLSASYYRCRHRRTHRRGTALGQHVLPGDSSERPQTVSAGKEGQSLHEHTAAAPGWIEPGDQQAQQIPALLSVPPVCLAIDLDSLAIAPGCVRAGSHGFSFLLG